MDLEEMKRRDRQYISENILTKSCSEIGRDLDIHPTKVARIARELGIDIHGRKKVESDTVNMSWHITVAKKKVCEWEGAVKLMGECGFPMVMPQEVREAYTTLRVWKVDGYSF